MFDLGMPSYASEIIAHRPLQRSASNGHAYKTGATPLKGTANTYSAD